jgi:hypothetical protein
MFENAINLGLEIFPSIGQSVAEVGHKAWQVGALAVDKDLFPRHCGGGRSRFCHQDNFFRSTRSLIDEE